MPQKQQNYFYQVFELTVESEIFFPELTPIATINHPDLKISFGKTPENLEGEQVVAKVRVQFSPTQFLIDVAKVGRYYTSNGNTITIEKHSNADEASIRAFLLETVIASVFYQRGAFLLAGSAIEYQGKAIAFIGNPGTGKSTTAASFIQKGYRLLADGICLIKADNPEKPVLEAFCPTIKLWKDVLHTCNFEKNTSTDLLQLRPEIEKYRLSFPDSKTYIHQSLPLGKVYLLESRVPDVFKIQNLNASEATQKIGNSRYRFNLFKEAIENTSNPLDICSAIVQNIPVSQVERFEEGNLKTNVNLLIEHIERDLETL